MQSTLSEKIRFSAPSTAGNPEVHSLTVGHYHGTVLADQPGNNTCMVRLDQDGTPVLCFWACGFFAALLGFKTSFVPPIGTRVLVYYSRQPVSMIVAAEPASGTDPGNPQRALLDPTGASNYPNSQVFAAKNNPMAAAVNSHKPPIDLVEGELSIDNLLGVGLALLRNLAALSAGDLARVECHVLNDMVRIISENFTHHTAFGDHRVVNDGGKLKVVWHGTSHEHEAWGLLRPQDAKLREDRPDHYDLDALTGSEEGRWRFSQYVGWLGDMINLYVTDPVNALGQLAESQVRPGKFRCHVNTDGSFLLQSVTEVVLEKVVRIPVPIQIRTEDDPQGNRTEDTPQPSDFLKTWRPSNQANLFEMAFQLRQYARWFNNEYSLGRFHGADRDFRVPLENEGAAPAIGSSHEADKEKLNLGVTNYRLAYATIRIYRDGSIQWLDAYGNSTTSSKIGIQIASSSNILLQAAGSVNIVAGRDINLLANRNVGLTSVAGKMVLRAATGLQMLATMGNTVLQAVAGKVVKIAGKLNVNDAVSIDTAGKVNVDNQVVAQRFAAAVTRFLDEHEGHIFPGAPSVAEVDDSFQHPTTYDSEPLYETMTQQMLRLGDLPEEASATQTVWDLSADNHPNYGCPWPGVSATQKQFSGGASLNQPASNYQGGEPNNMIAATPALKVKA